MRTSKHVLYSKINKRLALEYSAFKYGDPDVILKYGKAMTKEIAKLMKNSKRDYAFYAAQKYPVTPIQKKNSMLLAEYIAKSLKKELIVGEFRYKFDESKFYDNRVERIKIHKPVIKNKAKFKKHNYIVITIDDSIFSGLSFKTGFPQLKQITNHSISYTVIDLNDSRYSEKEINELFFTTYGISGLVKLIKKNGYVATSQMLRTFNKLDKLEKEQLLKKLTFQRRKEFKKACSIYFGKPLSI